MEKPDPADFPKTGPAGRGGRMRGPRAESARPAAQGTPETLDELSQLPNDALDVRAALRLAGGVACATTVEIGQGFVDRKVVIYAAAAGQPPAAHTEDGRWSPSRDPTLAAQLEELIRRRGLQEAYVLALTRLIGRPSEGRPAPAGTSELFALIHANPRLRTIAALAAIGETA
jgi:hypothetical protein